MEYFNLFDQYRLLHEKEKSGISIRQAVTVGVVLIICCAAVYAVAYIRNISLERQMAMLNEIQCNEEFQNQYNAALAINSVSKNIERDKEYLKLLEKYEIARNVGNYSLISRIEDDLDENLDIEEFNISGTEITIKGNADTIRQIEDSLINLRRETSFTPALCSRIEAADEEGVSTSDDPEPTENGGKAETEAKRPLRYSMEFYLIGGAVTDEEN